MRELRSRINVRVRNKRVRFLFSNAPYKIGDRTAAPVVAIGVPEQVQAILYETASRTIALCTSTGSPTRIGRLLNHPREDLKQKLPPNIRLITVQQGNPIVLQVLKGRIFAV